MPSFSRKDIPRVTINTPNISLFRQIFINQKIILTNANTNFRISKLILFFSGLFQTFPDPIALALNRVNPVLKIIMPSP
jgi:hypothetical protein